VSCAKILIIYHPFFNNPLKISHFTILTYHQSALCQAGFHTLFCLISIVCILIIVQPNNFLIRPHDKIRHPFPAVILPAQMNDIPSGQFLRDYIIPFQFFQAKAEEEDILYD
jgi:hypothetical protein